MNVPVHGWTTDDTDWEALHKAVDAHWLTAGPSTLAFEKALQEHFGRRCALIVNSGSSANLLAMTALELSKGSEVITSAVAFPTTVNPIVQCGLVPVFVDCELGTWNIDTNQLEAALSDKTRAVIVTHTLGNPVDLMAVDEFCQKHNLYLIEDCCDAAGATYNGMPVGSFSNFSTYSFYPAHQIATGEGGALLTDDARLARVAASYRDWGRDCWCPTGQDNTCGKRFGGEYDHKYTYSRIGYGLRATDLQAAIGLTQLARISSFVEKRGENWEYLLLGLMGLPLTWPLKQWDSEPSWFGFAFGVENRNELARYLDARGVGCRPLFGGNIVRQPAYKNVEYRIVGDLHNSNYVHDHVLFVGVWPGLTKEMLDYTIETLKGYFA